MSVAGEIIGLFETRGGEAYFGEGVSQLEHALQAAHLAESANAAGSLILAALLHDIGHLLHGRPESIADLGQDGERQDVGSDWLVGRFPAEMVEPVRLHVAAKRYLCATDSSYRARLSPASERSLLLRGGPMSGAEARAFEQNPHFHEAVLLRRWDDEAKVQQLAVPGLDHYSERLIAAELQHAG